MSLKKELVTFMTEEEIQEVVLQLAKTIEKDYAGKELHIVCPLKGSILFATDLVKKIDLPIIMEFVHLTSPKNQSVVIHKDLQGDITNKHVLIVEEIIDAGRTLSFLRNRILASNPASVKILTLLDKPARRELPIRPDYAGRTIDDRFVVGYGLDSEEMGRNYKDLYNYRN